MSEYGACALRVSPLVSGSLNRATRARSRPQVTSRTPEKFPLVGTETIWHGYESDGFPPFPLPMDPFRRGHQFCGHWQKSRFCASSLSASMARRRNGADGPPWKKPDTSVYYLHRQILTPLQGGEGKAVRPHVAWRPGSGQSDPALGAEIAELQRSLDAAAAGVTATAAAVEISPERASIEADMRSAYIEQGPAG